MEIFSNIVLVITGIAFIVLGVFFVVLISGNVHRGRLERERELQRAEELRISSMLSSLGFDFRKYLHEESLSKVKQALDSCQECSTTTTTEQCDTTLGKGRLTLDDIGFCPNQASLSGYVESKAVR